MAHSSKYFLIYLRKHPKYPGDKSRGIWRGEGTSRRTLRQSYVSRAFGGLMDRTSLQAKLECIRALHDKIKKRDPEIADGIDDVAASINQDKKNKNDKKGISGNLNDKDDASKDKSDIKENSGAKKNTKNNSKQSENAAGAKK